MKFQLRRPEDPDLNMTSLIDVVLLLLIFFMMSTRFVDESRLTVHDQFCPGCVLVSILTGNYRSPLGPIARLENLFNF